MTTFQFEEAEYDREASGGRSKEPNPFHEVVASIALKIDPKTDKPVARKFTIEHDEDLDARDKEIARIKRQLADAGKTNEPPVSVFATAKPVKNPVNGVESKRKTVITFWTIAKVTRAKSRDVETETVNA